MEKIIGGHLQIPSTTILQLRKLQLLDLVELELVLPEMLALESSLGLFPIRNFT
jgi:hypothetical protein